MTTMSPECVDAMAVEQRDEAARKQAIESPANVLLQAPAGSGKTTVLVCRFLRLLASVDRPEEILAITFTRKAAAEMRARVLKALAAAEAGVLEETPSRERPYAQAALLNARNRGWKLRETPTRLRIQTIDAFNQGLVRRLPIRAGAGAEPEIAQPADALYAEASRRTLDQALADETLAGALPPLLDRVDNNWQRLHELLALMLSTRAHWLRHLLGDTAIDLRARVQASLEAMLRHELDALVAMLPSELVAEAIVLAQHAAQTLAGRDGGKAAPSDWLGSEMTLGAEPADLGRWQFLARLALTGEGCWRKKVDVRNGFATQPAVMKERMLEWIEAARKINGLEEKLAALPVLPAARLSTEDAGALDALTLLLKTAVLQLQLLFAETGLADYPQIAGAARAALSEAGEPTDLALQLGTTLRHILVDEFQDTSIEQVALLAALTAGWEQRDASTLFAVGDPMQSIYQFREADVGLYLRVRDRGIGDQEFKALALHRNFRSAPQIVAWVNEAFSRLFPERDDPLHSGVAYLDSVAASHELQGAVQLHAGVDLSPEAEARRVLGIVREARARDPAARIAVLVANRRHAVASVVALRAAGIEVRGMKLEPLAERPVVRDLSTLARALQHLGDRTAWLALLRAPWCGLRLLTLTRLAADAEALLWRQLHDVALDDLDVGERAGIMRVRRALQPAIEGGERLLGLPARVWRCWERLGGSSIHATARDRDDAASFLDALGDTSDVDLRVGDALADVAKGAYASARAADDAVDVLTMHGAKGLEWDVVIVPGLGERNARDPEPLLHWIEFPDGSGEQGLLLAPFRASGDSTPGSLGGYIRSIRRRRAGLERMRLLYVTATRARRALHWLGSAVSSDDEDGCRPRGGSLLASLWPVLREEFIANAERMPPAVPRDTTLPPSFPRVAAGWEPPVVAPLACERLPLSLAEPGMEPEYSWVGLTARAVGTIVHAELQRFGRGEAASVHAPELYRSWVAEFGVPESERELAAGRIAAALERTLADPRGCWLLDGHHAQASTELRLSGLENGRIVSVILDRSFVTSEGERWIIDYKTSTHEGGGTEEFLASEAARYRPQLARYAALARELGPEPVRTALYFPLLGAFLEVAPDSERPGE
jgi:ATP-dependent exoDNAse (exonuclease V) beta subunit